MTRRWPLTRAFLASASFVFIPPPLPPLGGNPPSNTAVPVISGNPIAGYTLTADNGLWTNSPTVYIYQWYRGGSPISGGTSASYVLTTADIGSTIFRSTAAVNSAGTSAAALTAATYAVSAAPDVVVAPNGNDANPGTLAAPVRTYARAQTMMRAMIAGNAARNYTVIFRGGRYPQSTTLVMSVADKVNDGFATHWRNYPGEDACVSGGIDISSLFTDNGNGTWTANLSTGWRPHCLWLDKGDGNGDIRAQWPCYPAKGQTRLQTTVLGSSSGSAAGDVVKCANAGNKISIVSNSLWYAKATLAGGILTSGNQTLSNWTSITNGSMSITVDGVVRNLSGLNFSSAADLTAVASIIDAALPATVALTWDGVDQFSITSTNSSVSSSVTATLTYASATGSGTDISAQLKLTSATAASAPVNNQMRAPVNSDTFGISSTDLTTLNGFSNLTDIYVRIQDAHYCDNLLRIESKSGNLITLNSHSYRTVWPAGTNFRFENVYEAGQPGDCYINRSTGVVTYWAMPGDALGQTTITAPYLDKLMVISGAEAYSGSTAGVDAGTLKFSLRFSHTGSPTARQGYIGEADASCELFYGAVTMAGAGNVTFDHHEFRAIGEQAVVGGPLTYRIAYTNCDFNDLGAGGIIHSPVVCQSYDRWPQNGLTIPRQLITANWNQILPDSMLDKQSHILFQNSRITKFGLDCSQAAAFWTNEGLDITLLNFELSYGPGWGLHFGDNLNMTSPATTLSGLGQKSGAIRVSLGHIHHFGYERGNILPWATDCGPVYAWCSHRGVYNNQTGCIFDSLHVHDCYYWGDGFGPYFDNHSELTVAQNCVFANNSQLWQIKGRDNIVQNCLFYFNAGARAQGGFSMSAVNYNPAVNAFENNTRTDSVFGGKHLMFRNNAVVWRSNSNSSDYLIRQNSDTAMNDGVFVNLDTATIDQDYNVICKIGATTKPAINQTWAQWQSMGRDVHTSFANPLFADPDNLDFAVGVGSPLLTSGLGCDMSIIVATIANAGLSGPVGLQ